MSNTIIYNDGELELNVSVDDETVWLRQDEIASIFNIDRTSATRHINKIFKDNEVDEKSNVQKMHFANSDKPVKLYSLDIILAIGYRVNSVKAIYFRKWATSILKQYIQNGYSINTQKITNERFVSLENEVTSLQNNMGKINTLIKDNTLELKQGIFYNGQIFDAYIFISDIIKQSKKSIILIDNYVDDTTLTLFSKNQDINISIYTKTISKQLKLDIQKYNKQYKNLSVKITKNFHDRFMIIDNEKVFHIGSSLKDLGNKTFAFTQININISDIILNLKLKL